VYGYLVCLCNFASTERHKNALFQSTESWANFFCIFNPVTEGELKNKFLAGSGVLDGKYSMNYCGDVCPIDVTSIEEVIYSSCVLRWGVSVFVDSQYGIFTRTCTGTACQFHICDCSTGTGTCFLLGWASEFKSE
jgi:hypothetical protein